MTQQQEDQEMNIDIHGANPEKYKQIKSNNPLIQETQKRLHLLNKNWLCIIIGPTGSGKSWAALSVAEKIMPDGEFDIDNIALGAKDFLKGVKEDRWSQGDIVIFDEVGVEMNNKEFMTKINRAIDKVMQSFRRNNIGVIFTVPSQAQADSSLDPVLHAQIRTFRGGINYITDKNKVKWKYRQHNPEVGKKGKTYKKNKTVTIGKAGQLPYKVTRIKVPKPSDQAIKAYEKARDSYQGDVESDVFNHAFNEGKEKKKDKGPTKKEKIKKLVRDKPELTNREIAKKIDSSYAYVRDVATTVRSED